MPTFADFYNPLQTMAQIEQVKQAQQQKQLQQMQLQQAQQQQVRDAAFQQHVAGQGGMSLLGSLQAQQPPQPQMPQPMAPQTQQPQPQAPVAGQPPVVDESMEKVQQLRTDIDAEFRREKPDAAKINAMVQAGRRDPQIQGAIQQSGFDNIDMGYDEKTKQAWERYTKTWTKRELAYIAKTIPGGQALRGLPEGKYTIEYDPIKKSIRPMVKQPSAIAGHMFGDKNVTENEIIFRAMQGDVSAKKWMDAKVAFERRKVIAKGGELNPEARRLIAKQAILDPKIISKLPRTGGSRVAVVNEMEAIAKENGLMMPDITLKRADLNSDVKSYNKQKMQLDADNKLANEFYADAAAIKPKIEAVRTNYPQIVNMTVRQLRQLAASPGLSKEKELALEFEPLINSYMRVALDASGSISELSVGAQERQKKLTSLDDPAFVLISSVENMENQMRRRIGSRSNTLEGLRKRIEKVSTFEKPKTKKKKPKKTITVGRFTVEVE